MSANLPPLPPSTQGGNSHDSLLRLLENGHQLPNMGGQHTHDPDRHNDPLWHSLQRWLREERDNLGDRSREHHFLNVQPQRGGPVTSFVARHQNVSHFQRPNEFSFPLSPNSVYQALNYASAQAVTLGRHYGEGGYERPMGEPQWQREVHRKGHGSGSVQQGHTGYTDFFMHIDVNQNNTDSQVHKAISQMSETTVSDDEITGVNEERHTYEGVGDFGGQLKQEESAKFTKQVTTKKNKPRAVGGRKKAAQVESTHDVGGEEKKTAREKRKLKAVREGEDTEQQKSKRRKKVQAEKVEKEEGVDDSPSSAVRAKAKPQRRTKAKVMESEDEDKKSAKPILALDGSQAPRSFMRHPIITGFATPALPPYASEIEDDKSDGGKKRRKKTAEGGKPQEIFNYTAAHFWFRHFLSTVCTDEQVDEIEALTAQSLEAHMEVIVQLDYRDLCFLEDIYERQAQLHGKFLHAICVPGVITNRSGKVLYANREFLELLQYDVTDIGDTNFMRMLDPDHLYSFCKLLVGFVFRPGGQDWMITDTVFQRNQSKEKVSVRMSVRLHRDLYTLPGTVTFIVMPYNYQPDAHSLRLENVAIF